MTDKPDLIALLEEGRHRQAGRRPKLPSDLAKARSAEIRRRWIITRNMAQTALRRLHYDDYRSLTEQAQAKVAAECGPLPGDEVAS